MSNFYTTTHTPVMLSESLQYLQPKAGEVYIDCTFGAGGYSKAILAATNCILYSIDQDPEVEYFANRLKMQVGNRFKFIKGNFADLCELMSAQNIQEVDGIVLDLGVSSMQLETADRGFSFMHDSRLDMRMSRHGADAYNFINSSNEEELANVIYHYGGEIRSRKIAKKIVEARKIAKIETTLQLANLIRSVVPRGKDKIDSATKTFQAIRIFVNDELEALKSVLFAAERLLNENGRLVVVSFHSLEDGIVKAFINERVKPKPPSSRHLPFEADTNFKPTFEWLINKFGKPTIEEIKHNPRSRSAKVRAAVRINKEKDYV